MLWDCYLNVELWKKTQTHLDDTCGAGERERGTGGHSIHGGLVVPVGRFWLRPFTDRPEAGQWAGVWLCPWCQSWPRACCGFAQTPGGSVCPDTQGAEPH